MVLETVAGVAAVEPGLQLLLSLCSLITMVTLLTACVCCKKPMKHRGDDVEEAYGVIPADDPTSPRVNFRFGNGGHTGDRHSQPASKQHSSSASFGPRTSAPIHSHPPRALPPIPADDEGTEKSTGVSALYAQIDKRAKSVGRSEERDEIEYADGGGEEGQIHGTYDTIDDDDIDQLYSSVRPQARRYDYPQFKRTTPPAANGKTEGGGGKTEQRQQPPTDPTYQSASQIYGPPASEDPYSSIASGPRATQRAAGGGDSSSAYDPGYARVRPEGRAGRSSDDVEGELDHLYSKIRRSGSRERTWERDGGEETRSDDSRPTASLAGLPGSRMGSTMGGGDQGSNGDGRRIEGDYGRVPPFGRPGAGPAINNNNGNGVDADNQSQSSRDPSYRYITVRESAETIRARLEREQRFPPSSGSAPSAAPSSTPAREHYYSTIGGGSERLYESVDETLAPRPPGAQLAVDTRDAAPGSGHPPLPPTSPIPDRNALQAGVSPGRSGASPGQLYASINKPAKSASSKSPSPGPHPLPPSTRSSLPYPSQGNGSAPARIEGHNNEGTTTTPAQKTTSSPTAAAPLTAAVSLQQKQQQQQLQQARQSARSPFDKPRHATIVKPEDDGFEGGPKVVRPPPAERIPSEERSSVARYDVDLRTREQSPGRLRRDSSADRSTQTVQRPSVMQDNGQLRDRRASPVTVSPGIPLMNGSLPPSMSSSINNSYGIDRSIIDPALTSSVISESVAHPEEMMRTSVTTTETTSTDPSGAVLSRRVVEERETVCERRSICSSRSSSSVQFAASEDEMDYGPEVHHSSGAYSARAPAGARTRHDSGGSQSARYTSHSLERRGGPPGPEFTHGGDRIYRVPIHLTDSSQSLADAADAQTRSAREGRSALPRRQSSEELRSAHERSRKRRESAERASPAPPTGRSSGAMTPRAASRARREREEELARRLGSIYTGRDYVSPIDLTTQRAWPLVGQSSPPSLRRESAAAAAADEDLTPRAPVQPMSGRGATSDRANNNNANRKQPPPIQNGLAGLLRTDL